MKYENARDCADWSRPNTFLAMLCWSSPDTNSYMPRQKISSPIMLIPLFIIQRSGKLENPKETADVCFSALEKRPAIYLIERAQFSPLVDVARQLRCLHVFDSQIHSISSPCHILMILRTFTIIIIFSLQKGNSNQSAKFSHLYSLICCQSPSPLYEIQLSRPLSLFRCNFDFLRKQRKEGRA